MIEYTIGRKKSLAPSQIMQVRATVPPTSLRSLVITMSNVKWNDIIGHESVKSRLKETTVWIYEHKEHLERLGVKPSKGILLHGPPGVGKTTLVKAVASESRANFLSFNSSDLLRTEVGESEKKIAEIFKLARENEPCILFFDEIQSIFGLDASHLFNSLQAQFLLELDGIVPRNDVIVIAATNMPQKLSSSILRPGRFDQLIHIPSPDTDARREITMYFSQRMNTSEKLKESDIVDKIVINTEGASGADIKGMFNKAALSAMRRNSHVIEEEDLMQFINFKPNTTIPNFEFNNSEDYFFF